MAQLPVRVNTQTSLFPLLSELQGATVIDARGDQTYIPSVNPADNAGPVDRGNPQIFYCHNVMPSTYGLQSIGFKKIYEGEEQNRFQKIKLLVASTDKVRTYVALDYESEKTIKVLRQDGTWSIPTGAPTGLTKDNQISIATVNGVSYICVALKNVYKYNYEDNELEVVDLDGLNEEEIRGLLSANGYLIAWSLTGVNWSSVNDPLDFVPSDVTGAGGGKLQEAKGDIVWAQETSYGFIVYTEANIISATFSGNNTFPFNFKDLAGGGGIADGDMISQESTGTQYAYTTNGLQSVFHTGVKTILPYITDFIAGKVFEDFNEDTNTLEISTIDSPFRKKITLINDRYLVVSYGLYQSQQFTHAIILDLTQSRMGKVKIPHNAAFELKTLDPEVGDTPRESIAFLDETGEVNVIDFNIRKEDDQGVMILGKYQFVRQTGIEIQTADIQNAVEVGNLTTYLLPIQEGKNFIGVYPEYVLQQDSTSKLVSYPSAPACKSFSILFKGSFNLVSLVLMMNIHGRFW